MVNSVSYANETEVGTERLPNAAVQQLVGWGLIQVFEVFLTQIFRQGTEQKQEMFNVIAYKVRRFLAKLKVPYCAKFPLPCF